MKEIALTACGLWKYLWNNKDPKNSCFFLWSNKATLCIKFKPFQWWMPSLCCVDLLIKFLTWCFLHFRFRKIEINLEVIFLGLIEQYFLSYYIPKTLICYWCGKHVIKVKIDFAIVCESFRTLTSPLLFSNIYKLCILLYNDVPGH